MTKTLVIGDTHGNIKAVKAALSEGFPVVFLGDYLDSKDRSIEDQVKTLRTVLKAIEEGKAVGLFGNHDIQYHYGFQSSSGYRKKTQDYVTHLDMSVLKDYYWCEGFLLTHAGVNQEMLEYEGYSSVEDYLNDTEKKDRFDWCGWARGGHRPRGGLRWNDYNWEFIPVPGVNQVFGHTRGKEIREIDNNWCIDVLEDDYSTSYKGLLIEDGKAEIYEF